jgi:putative hydrolase of the HAD superfamily
MRGNEPAIEQIAQQTKTMKYLPPFLLFDLDDTILSFSAAGDACWETLCTEYAPRLGDLRPEDLLAEINSVRRWYWSDLERHRQGRMDMQGARRQIVRLVFDQLHLEDTALSDELADAFTRQREALVQPFPGAVETLQALQGRGIRMALITNGDARFQRAKIERFGLEPYFNPILIESEFGVGKPDPRPFRQALACLGAGPEQAWMVGDDFEYDLRPAQALGIGTVWVDHTGHGLPPETAPAPDHTVRGLMELLSLAETTFER